MLLDRLAKCVLRTTDALTTQGAIRCNACTGDARAGAQCARPIALVTSIRGAAVYLHLCQLVAHFSHVHLYCSPLVQLCLLFGCSIKTDSWMHPPWRTVLCRRFSKSAKSNSATSRVSDKIARFYSLKWTDMLDFSIGSASQVSHAPNKS